MIRTIAVKYGLCPRVVVCIAAHLYGQSDITRRVDDREAPSAAAARPVRFETPAGVLVRVGEVWTHDDALTCFEREFVGSEYAEDGIFISDGAPIDPFALISDTDEVLTVARLPENFGAERLARSGSLGLLRWAVIRYGQVMYVRHLDAAVEGGDIATVRWVLKYGAHWPWGYGSIAWADRHTCIAQLGGHDELIQWAVDNDHIIVHHAIGDRIVAKDGVW